MERLRLQVEELRTTLRQSGARSTCDGVRATCAPLDDAAEDDSDESTCAHARGGGGGGAAAAEHAACATTEGAPTAPAQEAAAPLEEVRGESTARPSSAGAYEPHADAEASAAQCAGLHTRERRGSGGRVSEASDSCRSSTGKRVSFSSREPGMGEDADDSQHWV